MQWLCKAVSTTSSKASIKRSAMIHSSTKTAGLNHGYTFVFPRLRPCMLDASVPKCVLGYTMSLPFLLFLVRDDTDGFQLFYYNLNKRFPFNTRPAFRSRCGTVADPGVAPGICTCGQALEADRLHVARVSRANFSLRIRRRGIACLSF